MKIGIDARAAKWYRGTGIGTYTYQLINYLNKIDSIDNYLLFIPEVSNLDISFSSNFSIRNITEKNGANFWDEVNIPNILKDKDIDLYHVPQNGVGLPLDKKCPFVITLHDVIPYKMPETVSERYLKIFNEELPKLIPLCDGIITVSNYSKEDIAKAFNYPEEKIYVTYLAAEDIYRPIDKVKSKAIIKNIYGISEDYVLYVGGFSPRKNIPGLIEAFGKLIPKLNRDIKLVIAGNKGKSYINYKNYVDKLNLSDKVIFPGFISIEHMPYLYNAAELFVYPSFYEGFGLPPLEAMACGIPVVASNVTSIPEILNNNALLVDPHNTEELCASLYKGLYDEFLKETLAYKGLLLSKQYNWEKTAAATKSVYRKILKA